jgi:hypothetical protein
MPRWYSPSTKGTVTSDVVHVKASTEAELAKYKGQLVGKIVILQAARPVRMLEDRVLLRMTDSDWAEAMKLPEPRPCGRGSCRHRRDDPATVCSTRSTIPRR